MTVPKGQHSAAARGIVLVTSSLESGGAERALSSMANYWAARGRRVTVATVSGPDSSDFYSLSPAVAREWLTPPSARRARGQFRINFTRIRRLRSLLRRERPAAVLSFIEVPNILTILAATGLHVRVVVSERGCPQRTRESGLYPLGRHWHFLRRLLYRHADAITALNRDTVQWLRGECGVTARIVPLALRELPQVQQSTREPLILAMGRLNPVKGFDILLRAFALVCRDFPEWTLTLIGNGAQRAVLLAESEAMGLGNRIRFIDPVRNVEEWFSRAGIVVSASRSEAFGNVVLEAMAMGAPVISTRCSGPAAFIEDGVNGWLVPVEDPQALAAALRELMSDRALRDRLGREASKVRQRFREEDVMSQWAALLFAS